MKIEINFNQMLDRIKKMKTKHKWFCAGIAMIWITAIIAACGFHNAFKVAGTLTAGAFFVLSLLQAMEDNL